MQEHTITQSSQMQFAEPNLGNANAFPLGRVLVVNSDPLQLSDIKLQIRAALSGTKIYSAKSGTQALELVDQYEIDCVVLSPNTSDFTEYSLTKYLYHCTSLAPLPVIALADSSRGDEELRQLATDAGARIYLSNAQGGMSTIGQSLSGAMERSKIMQILEIQNRQIRLLREEREKYSVHTEALAHELLTPLAGVQEFISLVFDGVSGPVSEEQSKHLAFARGGCESIRRTVERLIVDREFEKLLGHTEYAIPASTANDEAQSSQPNLN